MKFCADAYVRALHLDAEENHISTQITLSVGVLLILSLEVATHSYSPSIGITVSSRKLSMLRYGRGR